jgi:hypothetical protein
VEKGVTKGPDVFLHRSERLVHLEVLKEYAHIVAFWIGLRNLVQALQPIPHQLRLTQFVHHRRLSIFRHRHLLAAGHSFYATRGVHLSALWSASPPKRKRTLGAGRGILTLL